MNTHPDMGNLVILNMNMVTKTSTNMRGIIQVTSLHVFG
ncbi:Uncharacterised protein [Mycobacterium tuberculosis]|nr:Uncharacterised protein [Mycobacterium tuberculosis]